MVVKYEKWRDVGGYKYNVVIGIMYDLLCCEYFTLEYKKLLRCNEF